MYRFGSVILHFIVIIIFLPTISVFTGVGCSDLAAVGNDEGTRQQGELLRRVARWQHDRHHLLRQNFQALELHRLKSWQFDNKKRLKVTKSEILPQEAWSLTCVNANRCLKNTLDKFNKNYWNAKGTISLDSR